jgi:riboflavin kinase/FMN adenylyltransferase
MRTLSELGKLRRKRRPVFLAAGFFDGVHKGHRKVLSGTADRAREQGGESWVLTFDRHPLEILKPERSPPLLTSSRHKLRLLGRLDLDGCLLLPFTPALAGREADAFIADLRRGMPSLREVFVGRNWHFGRGGSGDVRLLSKLGRQLGFGVTVVRPAVYGGAPISSTRIRASVAAGRLDEAAGMLGRPFSILGTVERGRAVGRKLGFPTANLAVENASLPPAGVYAVRARVGTGPVHGPAESSLHDGVLYMGRRPTFAENPPTGTTVELHLFDWHRRLYGEALEVLFVERMRGERRFASSEALKRRIRLDTEAARRVLKRTRA